MELIGAKFTFYLSSPPTVGLYIDVATGFFGASLLKRNILNRRTP